MSIQKNYPTISAAQVKIFYEALGQAIFDHNLEAVFDVRYYYDADVVSWMMLGFRQYYLRYDDDISKRKLLVRTLFPAGYLGKGYMLRPHALELENLFMAEQRIESACFSKSYKNQVSAFINEQGIKPYMIKISELISKPNKDGGDTISAVLKELASLSSDSFIALELANGTWQQRLNRLYRGLLKFDDLGESIAKIVSDSYLWKVYRVLSSMRPGRSFSFNNLVDATAIATLHGLVSSWKEGGDIPIVRFHTDTISILRMWHENKELSKGLNYSSIANRVFGSFLADSEKNKFIYRRSYYYILRASFEALRFPGVNVSQRIVRSPVSILELNSLYNELSKTLRNRGNDIAKRAASIPIGDRSLVEVITDLETLSFVRNVWSSYEPPKSLIKLVNGLGDVWNFVNSDETKEHINRELAREVKTLRKNVGEPLRRLRYWFRTVREIKKASSKIRRDIEKEKIRYSTPSAFRDLGLVRWGIDVDKTTVAEMEILADKILSENDDTSTEACGKLASRIAEVDNQELCITTCIILWFLGLFDYVSETIGKLEDALHGRSIEAGFLLMRLSARLRSGGRLSSSEKEKEIEYVEEIVKSSYSNSPRCLLGLGYLMFYAWYSELKKIVNSEKENTQNGKIREFSEKCLYYGEQAVMLLSEDELGRAFAINHCAYVSFMTNTDEKKCDKYIGMLKEYANNERVWNYRFADTVAMHEVKVVESILRKEASSRKENLIDSEENRALCRRVAEAEVMLKLAAPYFGDPEIPQHLLQMRMLKLEIDSEISGDGELSKQ